MATATETPSDNAHLKILVADDVPLNCQILRVFLERLGHEVVIAGDGAEALEKFSAEQPDLVLMDVLMPVMDGYEAARRIKAVCGERWVPLLFLSALDQEDNLVAGLEAGGDDYLAKPVNFIVLQAKLQSFERSIRTHVRLMQANAELRNYRERQEAENALADEVLSRQLQRRGLDDPAISFRLAPAASVSGDVVAAARSPDGSLYVMLADATGHGLAASISTLPLLTLFYEMVDWGMALPAIVARINDQLHQSLPASRFVAATLLAIDEKAHTIEAWLGGLPPMLVLDPSGCVKAALRSNHAPLGILEADGDFSGTQRVAWEPGGQIALYSDGLLEAEDRQGEAFGEARLAEALLTAEPRGRLASVENALRRHLAGVSPNDDVSLLLIDCGGNFG